VGGGGGAEAAAGSGAEEEEAIPMALGFVARDRVGGRRLRRRDEKSKA
jgi:hypothetical protein